MENNNWDRNDWQGKRKDQVEYSKTMVGVIIIIAIIVIITEIIIICYHYY
jgi:uncharacterized membrane protein YidH (DUF202 family)